MATAAADVQAVLQEALRAQEHEDEGEVSLALDSYYRASCQLNYFVDLHAEKGCALAELCEGLVHLYEQRMTVLRARQDSKGPQWVQFEQSRIPLNPCFTSSATTASTALNGDACSTGRLQQLLRLEQVQPQAVLAAAAGSGDMQQVFSQGLSTPTGNSSQMDLYNTCTRTVSGSLDDVVGLEDIKEELDEALFLPLQLPHLYTGIRRPAQTFLLYGPPGTGKTLLVEKVAAETGFTLLSLSPSMILSKWAGDSEKAISGVFDIAKTCRPSIIFLDEVDSLGQSRGSNTDPGARRLLTELLIQFTRAAGEEGVYVFGATNRMQDCDAALLRRFSRRIEVPLPGEASRAAFFDSMLARPEVESELSTEDLSLLVQLTEGYSGSDLADLCRTAALAPVRELMQQQRQQLGLNRKRRRLGSGLGLASSFAQSSRQSEESYAAAGSPVDSTGCTDGQASAQQLVTVAGCAGSGGAEQVPVGHAAEAQLRALVLADFKAALELVKPAAADAEASVMA